jgi:chromatin assembly factor 1 subunit A
LLHLLLLAFSAMPDLIRLVHGNLAGIKKLVKEFRLYWKNKTKEKPMEIDNDIVEKMDVDDSKKRSEESKHSDDLDMKDEAKQVSEAIAEDEFSISKRQLEIKITSIAVREKRDSYKKICWYVNDAVLEQYSMKDLPIPSAWELLSQPKKTPIKPKMEEQVNAGRKTPTVSITQFARPMSPSAIKAQFAAANAAALESKQKAAAEQAAKSADIPEQKSCVHNKKDGKAEQPKLNFFSPTKPQQWKMVATGSSQKDSKRLVLVSTQPLSGKSTTDQDKGKPKSVSNPSSKTMKSFSPKSSPAPTASQDDGKSVGVNVGVDLANTGENSMEAIVLD